MKSHNSQPKRVGLVAQLRQAQRYVQFHHPTLDKHQVDKLVLVGARLKKLDSSRLKETIMICQLDSHN